MLRILMATHGSADPRTGVYQNISGRADQLRRLGCTVDILTPADFPRLRHRRLDPVLLPIAVARRVRGYDLVVFHSYLGWAFHAARRWFDPAGRVATVTAFHGLEPLYHRAVVDELARTGERVSVGFRLLHHVIVPRLLASSCRASDAVLCLNAAERRYLVDKRWAPAERISIVFNSFNPALLRPRTYSEPAGRLLYVGQWLRGKGTRYLVEAMAMLAARRTVHLTCVGTRADSDRVLADFQPSVRLHVSVQPSVDQDQIAAALQQADVFVFPSLSEGSSTALLEAMASGLPIVTTAAGAAPDMLAHERSALFVPHADAAALAAASERLLDDRSLRQRLGEAAQEAARSLQRADCDAAYAECLMRAVRGRAARRAAAN